MRGELHRGAVQLGPVIAHKREKPAGARSHVKHLGVTRVAAFHPPRDERKRLPAHRVRGTQKQGLHLEVVQPGAIRAEPTVGLVVKVLEVIRGVPRRIWAELFKELLYTKHDVTSV